MRVFRAQSSLILRLRSRRTHAVFGGSAALRLCRCGPPSTAQSRRGVIGSVAVVWLRWLAMMLRVPDPNTLTLAQARRIARQRLAKAQQEQVEREPKRADAVEVARKRAALAADVVVHLSRLVSALNAAAEYAHCTGDVDGAEDLDYQRSMYAMLARQVSSEADNAHAHWVHLESRSRTT
jgi:hypothetical protein